MKLKSGSFSSTAAARDLERFEFEEVSMKKPFKAAQLVDKEENEQNITSFITNDSDRWDTHAISSLKSDGLGKGCLRRRAVEG